MGDSMVMEISSQLIGNCIKRSYQIADQMISVPIKVQNKLWKMHLRFSQNNVNKQAKNGNICSGCKCKFSEKGANFSNIFQDYFEVKSFSFVSHSNSVKSHWYTHTYV